MARLPARVDWIEHKRTGVKVALRLDKKKMTFQAEYGGQTYHSKDGAEVRAQALAAVEKSHQLTFQPVIRVEVPVRSSSCGSMYSMGTEGAGVALGLTRFYFSREDSLRQLRWEDYEADNIERLKGWRPSGFKGKPGEFTLPFHQPSRFSYGNERHYLPYSEEVWEGLQRIVEAIETAKGRLDTFLEDPGVVAKLVRIGTGAAYPLLDGPTTRKE